jgi:hypothetical protein
VKRLLFALSLLACAPADEERPAGQDLALPDRATFAPVADALQIGCGTLDCHGQPGRNLRLYGARGLRLQEGDTSAAGATTAAEYDASYWSLVGLEPERLSDVVADRGARPERLALVRKPRGRELHKGGTLMEPSDDLDRCLVRWLAGVPDQAACEAFTSKPRPPIP